MGVAAYLRAKTSWQVLHLERGVAESLPVFIQTWKGDGVLCRLENDETASAVESLDLPTVDLRGVYRLPGSAVFDTDPTSVAKMAAEHLWERGYRNFAFCGFRRIGFSEQRSEAFASFLAERDINPAIHVSSSRGGKMRANAPAEEIYGEVHMQRLVPWLKSLPKPVGVLACNDVRGRQVINACELAGLKVPDDVAIVGVDNDEVLCELSNPPLSSVVPDTYRLGFQGAEMLDGLMNGRAQPPEATVLIPPINVHTRLSTDFLAIDDPELVAALRYIRNSACTGINVDDVVRHCKISRSTLERRFIKYLGIGPKEQLMRVRFERVKSLLRETDHDLLQIAQLTGFRTKAHLITAFQNYAGTTPGQYRQSRGP